jgi:hypothetical protein
VIRLFRPFALFLVVAGTQLVFNALPALGTSGSGTDASKLQTSGVELNQQGLSGTFYEPATSGQGFEIEVFPNLVAPDVGLIQIDWFTFDTTAGGADHQRWYTLSGNVQTGQPTASVTIYRNVGGNFNSPPVTQSVAVGTATLRFDTCTSGQLDYTFADGSGRSGSIPLTRLTQNGTCSTTDERPSNSDSALGGNWFDPATSGQGFNVDVSPSSATLFLGWYTYAPAGSSAGEAGQRWYTGQGSFSPGMRTIALTLYQTTGGAFDSTAATPRTVAVGSATLAFRSCSTATLNFSFTGGSSSGASGSIDLRRVGPVPPGCTTDSPVPVTAQSPFAPGCDGVPPTGTVYAGAEVEPYIATDPLNTSHLIGVFQQDRWSDGGARGLRTGYSFDGGLTWSLTQTKFSRCTGGNATNGGDFARASDPWVSIGPDGIAYQIGIAFTGDTFAANSSSAVLASRSTDGGRTWSDPATLIRDGVSPFNDKESLTADPFTPGFAYATWDRLDQNGNGPSWFARTIDGGQSWEAAKPIYDPGGRNQTLNTHIVVTSNNDTHALYDFFTEFDTVGNTTTPHLAMIRSLDFGATWSAASTVSNLRAIGTHDPQDPSRELRDGANIASFAAGPNGVLVGVWQDSRFSGGAREGVAFTRSIDGGTTWSAPAQINGVPAVQALLPAVAVRPDGTIGVLYYDMRNDTADRATLLVDAWLTTSSDGITWTERHVAGPFDFNQAPMTEGGLFIGDYVGLASAAGEFAAFFSQTGPVVNSRTDIYASVFRSIAGPVADKSRRTYRAVESSAIELTPEWQQQLERSAQKTLLQRRAGAATGSVPVK